MRIVIRAVLKHGLLSGAIVIAGGLFATTALANTESGMHSDQKAKDLSFAKVDENGDGYISQSEFQNIKVEERLDHTALDQNNDGRLDHGETYDAGETYESQSTRDPTSSDWSSESDSDY